MAIVEAVRNEKKKLSRPAGLRPPGTANDDELMPESNMAVFKEYTKNTLENNQPNLFYQGETADLWREATKRWKDCKTQAQIIQRLEPIKESYIERSVLKWGLGYSFEELINLDNIYLATLKANNITNPLQKEAVKMLCKLQIETSKAILIGDTKTVKDYSTAYATFAKQAYLEDMIAETKTDEITTVAELYQFMEDQGFQFKFYDNFDRDDVDIAMKDIKEANKTVILESSGLNTLLEQMAQQRLEAAESDSMALAASKLSIEEMMRFQLDEEAVVETEDDSSVLEADEDEW